MLSDDDALSAVALDEGGVIVSSGKGAVHLSMSTISVALSTRLAAEHANADQRLVAAPVCGRPEAAATAKLFITAAGATDALGICSPYSRRWVRGRFSLAGAPGCQPGQTQWQFSDSIDDRSFGEAIALVGKAGIDRREYIFLTSTVFTAAIYRTYGSMIVEEKFMPAGFAAPWGPKDIRLTLAAAEGLHVPMPLASLPRDRFLRLLAQHGDALDRSAIGQLPAKDAGGP